jgi:hypothetical protein
MPEDKHPDRHRVRTESHPPDSFAPFADDAGVRTIGALSFENGTDRTGLAQARLLQQTLDAIVRALEGEDLPEAVAEAPEAAPKSVPNPFA